MYYLRLRIRDAAGEQLIERPSFVYVCTREENLEAPFTTTDASGGYRIEAGLLPIGERFATTDDYGMPSGEATVSDSVYVQAGTHSGATWRTVSVPIRIQDRSQGQRVDLMLP
jgi:hypothetical protein